MRERVKAHDRLLPPLTGHGPHLPPQRRWETCNIDDGVHQFLIDALIELPDHNSFEHRVRSHVAGLAISWTCLRRTFLFFMDTLDENDEVADWLQPAEDQSGTMWFEQSSQLAVSKGCSEGATAGQPSDAGRSAHACLKQTLKTAGLHIPARAFGKTQSCSPSFFRKKEKGRHTICPGSFSCSS